jgi:hypothetical protein
MARTNRTVVGYTGGREGESLLTLIGTGLIGLGIGHAVGRPGTGLVIGLGIGFLLISAIIGLARSRF